MKAPLAFFAALFFFTAPSFSQQSDVKAPGLPDAAADPKPGLTLTYSAGGKADTLAARLVALYVPANQPPTPFLGAWPFTAKWEGEIVSDLRAEYTFGADVLGTAKVTLNGAVIFEGNASASAKAAQLNKGANKLVVEFKSPEKGDAMLRLRWSAKDFPWEPVPPGVFQHDASAKELRGGERVRAGRMLFAQLRCTACHAGGDLLPKAGEGMPELAQDAPTFDDIGSKFNEPWLAAWISDPHSIRPHALMPRVFDGKPGAIDQRAADLAAFFTSTGTAAPEAKPFDDALTAQGGALFANLGCIACHAKPDADAGAKDEHDRVPLSHVSAKWKPAALIAYLKDPSARYKWSRMPNFRLSDEEASELTAYLFANSKRAFPAGPEGDAAKGAQLLVSVNCLNCHAGLPPTATPALAATLKDGWQRGCMAADAKDRGKAPDFVFSKVQRESLLAFAAADWSSLKQEVLPEFAERQIANMRCTACHTRDAGQSVWSKLDDEMAPLQAAAPLEEGEGKPVATTAIPLLTWFGEKLQPDFAAQFIAGAGTYKPRPWLVARMPGFSAPAEGLAKGLALQHGFPPVPTREEAPDKDKAAAGETLISENGGFNCMQCHAVGDRPATAVFEAPAPNFAYAHDRLRKEYYHRWVLYPQRVDPDTKMPRFADDTGKTPLTDILGGNAGEQFEAIWQYLQTFKK